MPSPAAPVRFNDVLDAGLPAGALGRTLRVHRSATAPRTRPGKWHLDELCISGPTIATDVVAHDLDENDTCRTCWALPTPLVAYHTLATELLKWRTQATTVLGTDPDRLTDTWGTGDTPATSWWLVTYTRLRQLQLGVQSQTGASAQGRSAQGRSEDAALNHWANDQLVPLLSQTLDHLAPATGWADQADWAARAVQVRTTIGESGWDWHYSLRLRDTEYPALVPMGMLLSEITRSGGQGGIPALLRSRVGDSWRAGQSVAQIRADTVAEGRAALARERGPQNSSQVPAGAPLPAGTYATIGEASTAAWRQLAAAEIETFTGALIERLTRQTHQTGEEPGEEPSEHPGGEADEVERVVVWRTRPGPDLTSALVYAHALCALPDGRVVSVMGKQVLDAITPTVGFSSPTKLDEEWGSAAGDSVEVLLAAHDLTERNLARTPQAALELARASHVA